VRGVVPRFFRSPPPCYLTLEGSGRPQGSPSPPYADRGASRRASGCRFRVSAAMPRRNALDWHEGIPSPYFRPRSAGETLVVYGVAGSHPGPQSVYARFSRNNFTLGEFLLGTGTLFDRAALPALLSRKRMAPESWRRAALNPARTDQGVSSVEPNGSGCGSEPFRLLSSPSLDAGGGGEHQAAHAPSRMASRTLTRDEGSNPPPSSKESANSRSLNGGCLRWR
jgi:hypothetical protein